MLQNKKHHKHFRSMLQLLDTRYIHEDTAKVMSWQHFTESGPSSFLILWDSFTIAVYKFPSASTSTQRCPLRFHMLHAPSLIQHNLPAPHFLPFMLYSAAHTKRGWWPWLVCICFMTSCLELPSPLCMYPSGFATSSMLMVQYNCSPVCTSPLYLCAAHLHYANIS